MIPNILLIPCRKKLIPSLLVLFLCYSLSAQEEINILGNVQSIPDGNIATSVVDRTDFEFANVGGSKTYEYTIENTGTLPLTINSITVGGDFAVAAPLAPASPIAAGSQASFSIRFAPTAVGLSTGTVIIDNSDTDESSYDFSIQGMGVNSSMSSWDPLLYPPSACSWASQDNNGINGPYASWNLAVADIESGGTNALISLQPDAYVGSYNYDNQNGNESCLGHQVATTLDADATQNGLSIVGSLNGCMTVIDLNSGAAADQWANFTNMNGLTIRNVYLKGWGGAMNINSCTNVLIEDCVFENSNNVASEVVHIANSSNVIFRRCKFLANVNPAGRALRVDNSGSSGSRILFEDCDFGCNSSNAEGAALMVGSSAFVQLTGNIFSGNQATASGKGGAINVAVGGDLVVENCQFISNSTNSSIATEGGGAIYVNGNSSTTPTNVLIDDCHFYENHTNSIGRGGAVVCRGNSTDVNRSNTVIQNSIFERNGADRGGALLAFNANVLLRNNLFVENQNAALTGNNGRGGALYYQNAAGNYSIVNNSFVGNLSASGQVGRNATGCGACFASISDNDYNGQTEVGLPNSGSSIGSSIAFSSLATTASNYDCSSGSYCAFTISGACLSNSISDFICSPLVANSGAINGQLWNDAEGDGIQQLTDVGIAAAYVLLYDESNYLIGTTNTDANGFYRFSGLLPGNYRVVFVNPDVITYPFASPANAAGSTENTDSDQAFETRVNGELRGATSANLALLAGSTINDVDLGLTNLFLPVEWRDFTATKINNSSLLNWSTDAELDNAYFDIMRSADAIVWENIGRISAKGNSLSVQHYTFTDETPLQGSNYYQIKQQDIDGPYSFSKIVSLNHQKSTIQLFPNPAVDYLYYHNNSSENSIIRITDIQGRPVEFSYSNNADYYAIDIRQLPSGVYILHSQQASESSQLLFTKK